MTTPVMVNVPAELVAAIPAGGQLWIQFGQPVIIVRDPADRRQHLTEADFTDLYGDNPDWLPGHA